MNTLTISTEYQILLTELGFYDGEIDGLYGLKTRAAVIKFQRLNGLMADGIIGPNTKHEFENQLAPINGRQDEIKIFRATHGYDRWPAENTEDLMKFYGDVGTRQTRIEAPYPMKLSWETDTVIKTIKCHEKVAESLYNILSRIKDEYSEKQIEEHGFNLYGGCSTVRKIRGGNRWSTHSWGIAIDLDPARNGLRTKWKDSGFAKPECRPFLDAFKDEGWYSLGREKGYDCMHFQACHR